MIAVIPRKTLIVEFHFRKFGCCKLTSLKDIPSLFFIVIIIIIIIIIIVINIIIIFFIIIIIIIIIIIWSLVHFLRIGIKNNSKWIAQKLLSE